MDPTSSTASTSTLQARLAPWTTPHGEQAPERYNVYARLIWQLADRTQGIAAAQLVALGDIARIFGRAALLMQQVAGRDGDPQLRGHDAVAAHVCQLDATQRLAQLVPATHPTWRTLQMLQLDVAEALMTEQAFARGYRRLRSLGRAAAIELVTARNALARVCPHVLAALDPRFDAAPHDEAIRHLSVALQILSDLKTWPADAAARRPSLVLAGFDQPLELSAPDAIRELKTALIACGHLGSVVELAADHVMLARRIAGGAPTSRLAMMMSELRGQIETIRRLLPA